VQDYSQSGEQKIILDHFGGEDRIRGLRGMTLLDLGANDGITLSNSRALIELGWGGVLVEPADIAYKKLAALYASTPTVRCINAAVTTQDGPIDFYDSGPHLKKNDTSLLSTTRPEELERWKKSGETFTKTVARGITFDTLKKEAGMHQFDFISIDCEGADLDILRQIDLIAVDCKMLCVEFNRKQAPEFIAYAERHGMQLHWKGWENLIFVRA
jgi:FkbM family methyltransferase